MIRFPTLPNEREKFMSSARRRLFGVDINKEALFRVAVSHFMLHTFRGSKETILNDVARKV